MNIKKINPIFILINVIILICVIIMFYHAGMTLILGKHYGYFFYKIVYIEWFFCIGFIFCSILNIILLIRSKSLNMFIKLCVGFAFMLVLCLSFETFMIVMSIGGSALDGSWSFMKFYESTMPNLILCFIGFPFSINLCFYQKTRNKRDKNIQNNEVRGIN